MERSRFISGILYLDLLLWLACGQAVTVTVAGLDLTQCLPAVDRLLAAEELGSLRDQVSFQFLLRAGYEHLEQIFDK